MRHLVAAGLAVVVGALWLLRASHAPPPAVVAPGAPSTGRPLARQAPLAPDGGPTDAAPAPPSTEGSTDLTAAPIGGARPWSATARPADGPDPFAAVPTVRTEADTRAGLAP